jgi:hypothetical protein
MMRLALAAAAAIASLSAAQASGLSCPASIEADDGMGEGLGTHAFRYVSFFDGDPADLTDLAPEDNSDKATIEQNWRLFRSPGRPIVMVCRYHDTQSTVQKEVPDDIKQCRLQGTMSGDGEIVGSPVLSCD